MHTTQRLFTLTQMQRKNVQRPKLIHILLDCEANVKLTLRHCCQKKVLLCFSTAQIPSSLPWGSIKYVLDRRCPQDQNNNTNTNSCPNWKTFRVWAYNHNEAETENKGSGWIPQIIFPKPSAGIYCSAISVIYTVFPFQAACDVICVWDSSFLTLNNINLEINFLFSFMMWEESWQSSVFDFL